MPESGIGTTTSASTGISRASSRPKLVRTSWTLWPKTTLSGRAKYTCSNTQCEGAADGNGRNERGPSRPMTSSLARLDVPYVLRPDQIEGAGLRAHHGRVAEGAEHEGAEAVGVAHGHQEVAGQDDERERPPHLPDRLDDCVGGRIGGRPGIEMQHDLGVAAGLEDGTLPHQIFAQLGRIDEVPVVAEGDLAVRTVDEKRLCIDDLAVARRRVPHVPMAVSRQGRRGVVSSMASDTCPMARVKCRRSPSLVAMPALSWPRC